MATLDWQLVKELFHTALQLAPSERARFLERTCSNDAALREQVELLLDAHEQDDSFLDGLPRLDPSFSAPRSTDRFHLEGRTLAHYEIGRRLGHGGMGDVYSALDLKLRRKVALKVLPPGSRSDEQRARFRREAASIAAIDHPNIIRVFSIETVDDLDFITMELVDGSSLGDAIPDGGVGLARFYELALPIIDAVAAAHDAAIIHRDIKPDNVMLDRDGHIKVVDFGLAKRAPRPGEAGESVSTSARAATALTREGMIIGTVPYMSPEQVLGKHVDERSDVFSLGVVLYELISGRKPFEGGSPTETLAQILDAQPQPLSEVTSDLPRALERTIHRCLTKDPSARYRDAGELLSELRAQQPSGRWTDWFRRLGFDDGLVQQLKRPPLVSTFAVALLVNAPLFLTLAAHFPRWDATFLKFLQMWPGQNLYLLLLFPFAAFFVALALHDLRRVTASIIFEAGASAVTVPPLSSRGIALIAGAFGAMMAFGSTGTVIGIDQLPVEQARTAFLASRVVVEAARDQDVSAVASRLRERAEEIPYAALNLEEALAPTALSGYASLEGLLYDLGVTIRQRSAENSEARDRIGRALRRMPARLDAGMPLLDALTYLQFAQSVELGWVRPTTFRQLYRWINLLELVAIMYVGTGLLLGTIAVLTLSARSRGRERLQANVMGAAVALAAGATLFAAWPPLRVYTTYVEAIIYPTPASRQIFPYVTYIASLIQGGSLMLVIARRYVAAVVPFAAALGLLGYTLFRSHDLFYIVDIQFGAGASTRHVVAFLAAIVPFLLSTCVLVRLLRRHARATVAGEDFAVH